MENNKQCLLRLPFNDYFSDYINLNKVTYISIDDTNYIVHFALDNDQTISFDLNDMKDELNRETYWFEFRKRIDEIDINEKRASKT